MLLRVSTAAVADDGDGMESSAAFRNTMLENALAEDDADADAAFAPFIV